MPSVPDQSPSTPQSALDLEAGLSALKQGDYQTAIAKLEPLALPSNHPLTTKVQMGLAVAYARMGEAVLSASLCQSLCENENPQVRDWATKTLASLAERYPQIAESLGTPAPGPREQTERKAESSPRPVISNPTQDADITGFTPFDPAAPPDLTRTDPTGFVPTQGASLRQPLAETAEPITAIQLDEPPSSSTPSFPTPEPLDQTPTRKPSASSLDETAILPGTTAWSVRKPSPAKTQSVSPRSPSNATDADPTGLTAVETSIPLYQPRWRQAGRLPQGKSLGPIKRWQLLLLQAGTAVALFYVVQAIAYNTTLYYSIVLTKIPFLGLRRDLFSPPVWPILLFLLVLFVASRWLLDGLLTVGYGLQPLSLSKLATYSPETAQSLQRFCRQQRIPIPALGVLPAAAPVALSYGCIPHVTRTVVSQGLLEQLADDEIAAIFASEIGHISGWDVPLLSLVMVLSQIPYTVYWLVSDWGNRKQSPISRGSATVLAVISYGLYALPRWVGLWLSRQRTYHSDRAAAELTGNPNGLARALLKIAIGTAKAVQTQQQTSYLLEGFDLLTPLGQRMATTLGSVYPHTPIESVLEWERTNPYRHWLAINNSHPPTGDRLNLIMLYARHWKLDTELDWANTSRSTANNQPKSKLTSRQWRTLLLQGAPFFGLAFGFATAYLFEALGWVGFRADIDQLSWMYGDHTLLRGLPLVGFSIGTFIRINPLFPDLPFANARTVRAANSLIDVLQPPDQIPVDSKPVQLDGRLIGRADIGNLLSQDLLLQTATGVIRLHCLSPWGPIGNLLPQDNRPVDLLNQDVVVTGWFRRGATPWIDVETIRTPGGRINRSGHPVWSTILGAIAAAWGIYTIFRGGIF